MYVLNLKTMSWKKMFSLESPPARLSGAFLQLKDRKYLIGGCKHPETPTDLYGDIWSLSFANVNWEVSASDLPGSVWANVEYNVRLPPKPRTSMEPFCLSSTSPPTPSARRSPTSLVDSPATTSPATENTSSTRTPKK